MVWALKYPLYVTLLGDLTLGSSLHVTCATKECGHNAPLDLMALLEQYGPEVEIVALQKAVYCPKCRKAGRHDKNLTWIRGHNGLLPEKDRLLGEIWNERHSK